MKVVLKADATPVIAKNRRYSALQRAFIETYTEKLEGHGLMKPKIQRHLDRCTAISAEAAAGKLPA